VKTVGRVMADECVTRWPPSADPFQVLERNLPPGIFSEQASSMQIIPSGVVPLSPGPYDSGTSCSSEAGPLRAGASGRSAEILSESLKLLRTARNSGRATGFNASFHPERIPDRGGPQPNASGVLEPREERPKAMPEGAVDGESSRRGGRPRAVASPTRDRAIRPRTWKEFQPFHGRSLADRTRAFHRPTDRP